MPWSSYIKLYLLTIPVFFAIDIFWLGIIAKNLYRKEIGHLMAESTNWPAAVIFYLIYIVGILIFAVVPSLSANWQKAVLWGAMFGFFTYATYDLTNLATLKGFPIKIVVLDIIWGTVLCGLVSVASFHIGKWLSL